MTYPVIFKGDTTATGADIIDWLDNEAKGYFDVWTLHSVFPGSRNHIMRCCPQLATGPTRISSKMSASTFAFMIQVHQGLKHNSAAPPGFQPSWVEFDFDLRTDALIFKLTF